MGLAMMNSRRLTGLRFNVLPCISFLLIFSLSSSLGQSRGPHHPRSSPQVHKDHHHKHYVPHREENVVQPKLTRDTNLLHDTEHLKEDMGEWLFTEGKELSPEEMEFHYFKSHDFDNNSFLDGLEILQAISHVLPMTDTHMDLTKNEAHMPNPEHLVPLSTAEIEMKRIELKKQKEEDFNYYIDLIDRVLEEDDLNKDGYLSYPEYVVGRRRDEMEAKKRPSY